jgi:hypothetical protein
MYRLYDTRAVADFFHVCGQFYGSAVQVFPRRGKVVEKETSRNNCSKIVSSYEFSYSLYFFTQVSAVVRQSGCAGQCTD